MTQICSVKQGGIQKEGNDYVVRSCDDQSIKFAMSSSIFQEFKPSSLDRKKMDQIIKKTDHVARINNNFGSKFSLVRGSWGYR